MVLIGGINEERILNSILIFGLTIKGGLNIDFENEVKFRCLEEGVGSEGGDYFPQNQWIVTEKNE